MTEVSLRGQGEVEVEEEGGSVNRGSPPFLTLRHLRLGLASVLRDCETLGVSLPSECAVEGADVVPDFTTECERKEKKGRARKERGERAVELLLLLLDEAFSPPWFHAASCSSQPASPTTRITGPRLLADSSISRNAEVSGFFKGVGVEGGNVVFLCDEQRRPTAPEKAREGLGRYSFCMSSYPLVDESGTAGKGEGEKKKAHVLCLHS